MVDKICSKLALVIALSAVLVLVSNIAKANSDCVRFYSQAGYCAKICQNGEDCHVICQYASHDFQSGGGQTFNIYINDGWSKPGYQYWKDVTLNAGEAYKLWGTIWSPQGGRDGICD